MGERQQNTTFSVIASYNGPMTVEHKLQHSFDGSIHINDGVEMIPTLARGPSVLHVHPIDGVDLKIQSVRFSALKSLSHQEFMTLFGYNRAWIQDREFLFRQLVLPFEIKAFFLKSVSNWEEVGLLQLGAFEAMLMNLSRIFQKMESDVYQDFDDLNEWRDSASIHDVLKSRIENFFSRAFVKIFIWSTRKMSSSMMSEMNPALICEFLIAEMAGGIDRSVALQLFLWGEIKWLDQLGGEADPVIYARARDAATNLKFYQSRFHLKKKDGSKGAGAQLMAEGQNI